MSFYFKLKLISNLPGTFNIKEKRVQWTCNLKIFFFHPVDQIISYNKTMHNDASVMSWWYKAVYKVDTCSYSNDHVVKMVKRFYNNSIYPFIIPLALCRSIDQVLVCVCVGGLQIHSLPTRIYKHKIWHLTDDKLKV